MVGGKYPIAGLLAIFGVVLAVIVALTSERNRPPVYHKVRLLFGK